MYSLILESLMFASLALIVYCMARAVPRVAEHEKVHGAPRGAFDRFLSSILLEAIDERIHSVSEKFLRKLKIVILKCDNFLSMHLKNLRARRTRAGKTKEQGELFGAPKSETK